MLVDVFGRLFRILEVDQAIGISLTDIAISLVIPAFIVLLFSPLYISDDRTELDFIDE
jgi:hypothetical protein